jgi:transposase-like protein
MTLNLPRARLPGLDGKTVEFRSSIVPKSRQMSQAVESLIVASYLCGVSTRKCETTLAEALGPGVSKSTVSRCLQNLKPDWEAWKKRDLSKDGIERLVLDGLVVPVRIGGKSEKIHVLVALGVRNDGRKLALCFHEMGSESKESWKELLEDLASRGVKQPAIVVTDGSKGWKPPSPRCGPRRPSSAARCTRSGTCWPTRPRAGTRRSRRSTRP